MPYPIVSKADARRYVVVDEGGGQTPPKSRYADPGDDLDWPTIGEQVAADLLAQIATCTKDGKIDGGAFEAAAGAAIHQRLPTHPALADPEFWIWLAVVHCEEVVDLRYPGKRNAQNFGIGGAGENLLYRLWLRAEIAYDAGAKDRYALSRFGDIDFWRSHVFRQGYGDVRTFAKALLEFQFPAETKRKPRLKIVEIRMLAKHLKRARSNLMFEVMTVQRATDFIVGEWARLASDTE